MKILLVEDDETIREMVALLLENLGHEVVMADSKHSACHIIQEQVKEFELVLTDNDLPTLDEGLEVIDFAQRATRLCRDTDIYFVLMSGRDKWFEAEEAGAVFLHKPFDLIGLATAIQQAATEKELAAA